MEKTVLLDIYKEQVNLAVNRICDYKRCVYHTQRDITVDNSITDKYYSFLVCLNGTISFRHGFHEVILNECDAALISNGDIDSYHVTENAELLYIALSGPDIEMLYNISANLPNHMKISMNNCPILATIMASYVEGCEDLHYLLKMSANIYSLMTYIIDISDIEDNSIVSKFVKYVESNITEKMTVGAIAKELLVSVSKLSKDVKRDLGVAPYNYILNCKLKDSETVLIAGRLTIAQIAYHYNFDSCAAFTTAFKKRRGITPAAYRDKWLHRSSSLRANDYCRAKNQKVQTSFNSLL